MTVDYTKEGTIAIFTLNRVDAMNAVDAELTAAMNRAMKEFDTDDNMQVGIITGAGNAFSIGADINTMLPLLKEAVAKKQVVPTVMDELSKVRKPLIAAINGAALGGGLELALACDIRIAAENALFGLPEVTLGIIPGWGGTQRLPRVVSPGIAAELMFTGRPMNSTRALQVGLVNMVVARNELMNSAKMMADRICKNAPLAVMAAKRAIKEGREMPLSQGLEFERELNAHLLFTEDFAAGRQASLNKKKPVFKGR